MGYDWSQVPDAEIEAMPDLLFVMREVAYMEERPKERGLCRTYWDFKKKNLEEFLKRWERMEEAFMYKAKETAAQAPEKVEDVGTDKAIGLCEQLIRDELEKIRSEP